MTQQGQQVQFLTAVKWLSAAILWLFLNSSNPVGATADQFVVGLHFRDSTAFEAFAGLNIPIYTQIDQQNGGIYAVTPVSAAIIQQLESMGIRVEVLGAHNPEAEYYWIHAPHAQSEGPGWDDVQILAANDQYWLVGAPDSANEAVRQLGASIERLFLHPIPNRPQPVQLAAISEVRYSPFIQQMMDQVHLSRLQTHIRNLSGVQPVTINGSPYTFSTRYTFAANEPDQSTAFVSAQLANLGLNTQYHYYYSWNFWLRNVIAEQPGITDPDCLIFIVGHLDSYSNNPYYSAPGADDNASGATGVLTTAEILSQYQFACTIRYILFSAEEQGYYGSYYYVQNQVVAHQENVVAVINLDMIGYNADIYPIIELHTRANHTGDLKIATLFSDVITTYQVAITPQIINGGLTWSDHKRFWDAGYPAIMAMEDSTLGSSSDFTPSYHTTNDTFGTINFPYLVEFIRATVGSVAHLAGFIPQTQLYFPLISK